MDQFCGERNEIEDNRIRKSENVYYRTHLLSAQIFIIYSLHRF